ncbi:MAG: glycerophosphoryl diester phosphodiesterase, partial [Bacteroidota bacterium]|nr:glycerophosphoryl diester phosphodiesterase [Bacteroidota bacterium]
MTMQTLREFAVGRKIFVAAHRGSSGTAPENTMSSFREALEVGAKMIETDIQFTSDDKIIAFHDARLERTSDGRGIVWEQNYDSISHLDAGKWFDSKYTGEKIPLLAEVIELIRSRAYLNIEIKSRRGSQVDERVEKILELINNTGIKDYSLFSSFDHKLLAQIKKIDEGYHTAAINIPGDSRLPSEIAKETGCEAFVCSIDEINYMSAEDAAEHNLYIGVYSIDTLEQLDFILNFNVTAIVSNFPGRIIEKLRTN